MSEDEPDDVDEIRQAIDQMSLGDPLDPTTRPRRAQAREISDDVRRRIEDALGDVAYVQHAYATDEHDVCRVGVRSEAGIEEDVVVVGPGGVARFHEVAERVDELRRGKAPSEVAGLLTDG